MHHLITATAMDGGSVDNAGAIIDHLDIWTTAALPQKSGGRGRKSGSGKSPHGIQKLRELILELAVRGKLVPQDPNDEPASELLKKIAAEKSKLLKGGKIRKEKPLPSIGETDKPFELKAGWEWLRLGNAGTVGSSSRVHQKDWITEGIPFYRAREIVKLSESGSVDNDLFISEELFQSLSENGLIPEVDDVMITGVGTIGVPYVVAKEDCFYFKDASVLIFKNYCRLSPRYLYIFLKSPYWINEIHSKSMGTTVHTLTISRAREVIIPLPPLEEQERIAAKVDELMALCDKLEQEQAESGEAHQVLVQTLLGTLTEAKDREELKAAWQRIAEHFDTLFTTEASIDQLKQTILQLAVMGKLVPQDPTDEPASELLKKITAKKSRLIKEGKIKKQKAAPELNAEELNSLPPGWTRAAFGSVIFNRDAERVPLSVDERKGRQGEYDYYGASGVIDNIDDYLFDKPLLLIGEDGANLINRSTPIAFMARGKYWVNNHAHVLDGLSEELLLYVCLHINAISLEPYITGTAQPKMNQAKMNTIPLALPPLEEQKRIVAKVDGLMAICDALKEQLQAAQQTQVLLADSIVEQAVG
ncbi:restriction endonuclease subunit S [Mariprofundus ferrooxydans]|uniref:restriction endonuclease subunit S n=1 Tax=Mariprofundus ferrooxydans TaxID=314344 RepID=UPI00197F63B5|nr:restriction endonuclease subunit S [Mariprofundus ferrooxydans]